MSIHLPPCGRTPVAVDFPVGGVADLIPLADLIDRYSDDVLGDLAAVATHFDFCGDPVRDQDTLDQYLAFRTQQQKGGGQ